MKLDDIIKKKRKPRKVKISIYASPYQKGYLDGEKETLKEFISLIQAKVLMDWKGQNEFIDWLKDKSGEKLRK